MNDKTNNNEENGKNLFIKFVFYNKLERDNNYSTRKMAIMIKQWMYNRTALPKKEEKIVQTYYPPDAFIVNNVVFPSSLLVPYLLPNQSVGSTPSLLLVYSVLVAYEMRYSLHPKAMRAPHRECCSILRHTEYVPSPSLRSGDQEGRLTLHNAIQHLTRTRNLTGHISKSSKNADVIHRTLCDTVNICKS